MHPTFGWYHTMVVWFEGFAFSDFPPICLWKKRNPPKSKPIESNPRISLLVLAFLSVVRTYFVYAGRYTSTIAQVQTSIDTAFDDLTAGIHII
jgi:hypothetical protein